MNVDKKMQLTDSIVTAIRESCAVCKNRELSLLFELPELPLTGLFSDQPMQKKPEGIDQKLLHCSNCGHVQIADQINPSVLYDDRYYFRTSVSSVARRGTGFFLKTLNEIAPDQTFQCVLDVGCNDLFLLNELKGRASARWGIDPIWKDREDEVEDKSIRVFGRLFEDIDFGREMSQAPDLIVCRHTLEHIFQPREILEKLLEIAAPDALLVFEVPNFNALLDRRRFDQVFHQHLQYFSVGSFKRLIEEMGGHFLGWREHYHDWGAMCIVFSKSGKQRPLPPMARTPGISSKGLILERYQNFQDQIAATKATLDSFKDEVMYGYGAAQMLPILAYHLKDDLSSLECVIDDDPAKKKMHYWNLPLAIRHSSEVGDLRESNIFMTAIDNVEPILTRLFKSRPRHIIYPLNII